MKFASRASLVAVSLILALLMAAPLSQQSARAQAPEQERSGVAGEGTAEAPRSGGEVYAQVCSVCHGGQGEGRLGPELDGNLNLARADYVTAIILRGRDGMPPYHDRLLEAEVEAVGEYVRTAWGNDFGLDDQANEEPSAGETENGDTDEAPEAEVPAESPLAAELAGPDAQWWQGAQDSAELFERVCARCHGEDGGGGFGPALVRNDNLSDRQYVVGKILHGQGGMPAFEGLLGARQIAALASYIRNAFGDSAGDVGLDTVLALQSSSPRENSGGLRATVFPGDARLSIVGPDRFVHFVSKAPSGRPTQLRGLLPGSYTVTGTKEGYRTAVAEVSVLPRHESRVTLNLQSFSQAPPPLAGEEGAPLAAETGLQTGVVASLLPPEIELGGAAYRRSCALCHGPEGQGGVGPPLAGNSNLQNVQFVLDRILHGTSRMPAFGNRLTAEQIAEIASFERSGWGNGFGAVTADQVAQQSEQQGLQTPPATFASGAEIYEEYCTICHGGMGYGGVGPALQGNDELANTAYTVSRIVMGGNGMPAFNRVLSSAQMAEIATFIRTAWGNQFGRVGIFQAQNYHGGSSGLAP